MRKGGGATVEFCFAGRAARVKYAPEPADGSTTFIHMRKFLVVFPLLLLLLPVAAQAQEPPLDPDDPAVVQPAPDAWPGGDEICGLDDPCEADPEDYIPETQSGPEGFEEIVTQDVKHDTPPSTAIRRPLLWREG